MGVRNVITGVLLLVGAAGLLGGFMLLHWFAALGFGMSGLQLVTEGARPESLVAQTPGGDNLGWLWLVLVTGVMAGLAAVSLISHPRRNRILLKLLLLVLAVATIYPFVVFFLFVNQRPEATMFIGVGFWVSLVGNILVLFSALFSG